MGLINNNISKKCKKKSLNHNHIVASISMKQGKSYYKPCSDIYISVQTFEVQMKCLNSSKKYYY